MTIPLLDNLIQQMSDRFGKTQQIASKLINLVPSVICSCTITAGNISIGRRSSSSSNSCSNGSGSDSDDDDDAANVSFDDLASFYEDDLPNSSLVIRGGRQSGRDKKLMLGHQIFG